MSKESFTYTLETVFDQTVEGLKLRLGDRARLGELYTPLNLQYHNKPEITAAIDRIKGLFSTGIEGYPTIKSIRIIVYRSDAKPYIWMSRYDLRLRDNEVTVTECVYNEIPP